jgi:hypothetical protein
VRTLALRLRSLVWMSGGGIRWRTVQTVLDAGYVDGFRMMHAGDPGLTLPTPAPHIRIDYVFVPSPFADRVVPAPQLLRLPYYPLLSRLSPSGLPEAGGVAGQECGDQCLRLRYQ